MHMEAGSQTPTIPRPGNAITDDMCRHWQREVYAHHFPSYLLFPVGTDADGVEGTASSLHTQSFAVLQQFVVLSNVNLELRNFLQNAAAKGKP